MLCTGETSEKIIGKTFPSVFRTAYAWCCTSVCGARRFVLRGAMSEVSVACSMVERMRNFVPDMGGVLAEDQAPGAVVVPDLMVMRCEELGDIE